MHVPTEEPLYPRAGRDGGAVPLVGTARAAAAAAAGSRRSVVSSPLAPLRLAKYGSLTGEEATPPSTTARERPRSSVTGTTTLE
ncbi:unnamed protein product [Boreogadus saida]